MPLEVSRALRAQYGQAVDATVTVVGADQQTLASDSGTVVIAEPGWTMVMVSHFHYDPVWWNTQAAYTSSWELLGPDGTTRPV